MLSAPLNRLSNVTNAYLLKAQGDGTLAFREKKGEYSQYKSLRQVSKTCFGEKLGSEYN